MVQNPNFSKALRQSRLASPTINALLFVVASISPIVIPTLATGETLPHLSGLPEDKEPARLLELTINGQTLLLSLNEEKEVQVGDFTSIIRARHHPVRVLKVRHLSFEYPSEFHFEASVAKTRDGFSKWDLKGQWVKLSLQRMTSDVSFADYVRQLREEVNSNDGTRSVKSETSISMTLGERKIAGTRFNVFAAPDAEVSVDYLDLLTTKDGCRYVLVIAYPSDDGAQEVNIVRQLLQNSLQVFERSG